MTFLKIRRGAFMAGVVAASVMMAGPAISQVRGGTIVAATDVQPRSLDPVMGNAPTSDRYTTNHLFDTLIHLSADGSLEPMLAESWEVVDDGLGFVLSLREDVTFHDGTPFNAEAVKFNLERTLDPDTGSLQANELSGMTGVEVVGPHSVKVSMSEVNMGFLAVLTGAAGMMSSPTAIQEMGAEDYGLNPVGTGPYIFDEWVIGSHVEMSSNPDYWREGLDGEMLPYSDGARVRYITSPAVKLIEVKTGAVHVAENIPVAEYAAIEADPDLQLVQVPAGVMQLMTYNTVREPIDDVRVRQAISYALDREFILQLVAEGYGTVANGPAATSGWDYDASRPAPISQDLDRARELLAEAGYADGLDLDLLIIQRDPDTLIAQVIQQQLAEVGVNVTIEAPERSGIVSFLQDGQWDLFLSRYNAPRPDPVQLYDQNYGRLAPSNWGQFEDEEVFDAVDSGRAAPTLEERKEFYLQAQEQLVDQAYFSFLFFRDARHVAQASLQNLTTDGAGAWDLAAAWVE